MKSKKSIITIPIIVLTIITIICISSYFCRKNEKEKAMQIFGIYETDDLVIGHYDLNIGLWNDKTLNISTQKNFEQFTDENVIVPVTITNEYDSIHKTKSDISYHTIQFNYKIGHKTIYGDFTVNSDSELHYIALNIHG